MSKISFSPEVHVDLTNRIQHLFLEALDMSGNWSEEAIRFQGGTCLNLVYGSPRFSEDLDFIVGTERGIARVMSQSRQRLQEKLHALLPDASVRMAGRDEDSDAPTAKNPRAFMLTVAHPDWYRNVKVKVEFWVADPDAVAPTPVGFERLRCCQVLPQGR